VGSTGCDSGTRGRSDCCRKANRPTRNRPRAACCLSAATCVKELVMGQMGAACSKMGMHTCRLAGAHGRRARLPWPRRIPCGDRWRRRSGRKFLFWSRGSCAPRRGGFLGQRGPRGVVSGLV
jgi:hypothetical protein